MKKYYLMKEGLYYRPEAKGYTDDMRKAGLFDEDYSKSSVDSCHGDVKRILAKFDKMYEGEAYINEFAQPYFGDVRGVVMNISFMTTQEEIELKRGDYIRIEILKKGEGSN